MNPLILAVLLAAQAPLLQEAQKQKAGAAANAREKSLYRAAELERVRRQTQAPGAGESLSGPLTFRFVAPDGRVLNFSGTGTLTIEGGTPIPQPEVTKLTGIRSTETGLLVTTTTPGSRLVLEGANLVDEGTLMTVTVGGERSAILRESEGMIEFVAPVVPANKPPLLVLYWLQSNQWTNKGQLPLTVQGSGPTPPIPPAPGLNPRVDSILPSGEHVILTGAGFGPTGLLLMDKRPMQVVSWEDSRIDCLMGQEKEFSRLVVDLWRPSEGWFTEAWEAQ